MKPSNLKLYDLEPSGNCYKVRLFCALAQIPIDLIPVDFMAGEHKTPKFLALNPLGELPILDDNGYILRDSQAILVYLASKYGGEAWLPKDPAHMAKVMQWLSTSANNVQNGPSAARLVDKFGYALDKATTIKNSNFILPIFEAHLGKNDWLEMERVTIADVACFPYIALSHEGGVSLVAYPNIRAWIARIKALPNFIAMPGV
jgi:glutathione S-transferase